MAIRIAVWLTIIFIVLVVIMASFVQFAAEGSDLHRMGQGFFDFIERITPG